MNSRGHHLILTMCHDIMLYTIMLYYVAEKYNMTFNDKCTISTETLNIMGYVIHNGTIKPDPERLRPLKELDPPHNLISQRRIVGMFAYYSKWIPKFSEKLQPLVQNTDFPLSLDALNSFNLLKKDIDDSLLSAIDENLPFEVETDASDVAIAATLNQAGRPVAFFSLTLNAGEKSHSSVEKEDYAIVDALLHWRHYLLGRHFKLITDQKSVSFMFDTSHKNSKIKNDKIMRWRVELSPFQYDIIYRPGKDNKGPDTLSRIYCLAVSSNSNTLKYLHDSL